MKEKFSTKVKLKASLILLECCFLIYKGDIILNKKQLSIFSRILTILFLSVLLSPLAISGSKYTPLHITASDSNQPSQPVMITLGKQVSYDNYATFSIKIYNESLTVSLTLLANHTGYILAGSSYYITAITITSFNVIIDSYNQTTFIREISPKDYSSNLRITKIGQTLNATFLYNINTGNSTYLTIKIGFGGTITTNTTTANYASYCAGNSCNTSFPNDAIIEIPYNFSLLSKTSTASIEMLLPIITIFPLYAIKKRTNKII